MATRKRTRKRNIEQGFYDKQGRFHPIRASKDYITALEYKTDMTSRAAARKRAAAAKKKKNPSVIRASENAIPGKWTTAKVRRIGGKVQVKF